MSDMKSLERYAEKIKKTTESKRFLNIVNQIRAKALLTELSQDITLTDWKYDALGLVRNLTASTMLMRTLSLQDSQIIIKYEQTLKQLASAWESLATLEESTDALLANLNASTLYELAGYQANAVCLAKKIELDIDSIIDQPQHLAILFLQRRFVNVIIDARKLLKEREQNNQSIIAQDKFARGVYSICLYFLGGEVNFLTSGLDDLRSSESAFDIVGSVFWSNLIHSIRSLIPIMDYRSSWKLIGTILPDSRWIRYLKLLARGMGTKILTSGSISELWPSQIKVLNEGILSSTSSKIVRMPTSAGKTRAGEMAISHTLISYPKSKCI